MTAPIASMMRSPAPSTRFNDCPPSGGCRSASGFLAKSWDIAAILILELSSIDNGDREDGGNGPTEKSRNRETEKTDGAFFFFLRFFVSLCETVASALSVPWSFWRPQHNRALD